jgi:hypothetical protein
VENEARLRHQIRQALDPVVPDAPWLRSNVRLALRGQRTEPRKLREFAPRAWSGTRTVAAILLAVVIITGLLVGSRELNRLRSVPGQSQTDPAVQKYRAVVDRGFSSVENLVLYGTPNSCNAARATDCREKVQTTRAATQRFLDELRNVPVPAALNAYDVQLKAGLADVNSALDAMLSDLDRKDFAAYAIDYGHLFDAKLDKLYPYVVAVDCWPKAAVHGFDVAGYDIIRCGATTAQQYLSEVASEWLALRSSLDSSITLCHAYGAACDERTSRSKELAQQFKDDINRTPVPIQLSSYEKDLEGGLTTLIAALDERMTAIAADDHPRWDSANVTIDQVQFNVIAKAVGQMACWPNGVHIGDDSSPTAWPCAS